MKAQRCFWSGALLAALFLSPAPAAEACGDKFVRVGRGGRFQRGYVAVHPASILVFVNSASAGAPSMQKLPATLKAAGHKPLAVTTPGAFAEALKARRYDLVVAEAADVPRLSGVVAAAAFPPQVLPVLRRPSKAEVTAAEKAQAHACVIADPDKKYEVLVDVDAVMAASRK